MLFMLFCMTSIIFGSCCFFFNDTATTEIYTLSLHDALPISRWSSGSARHTWTKRRRWTTSRSEEHTSELQSRGHLVCRLLLEKKKRYLQRERQFLIFDYVILENHLHLIA